MNREEQANTKQTSEQEITWVTGAEGAKVAFKDVPVDKVVRICEILGEPLDESYTEYSMEDSCGDTVYRQAVLNYIDRLRNQGTGKKKSLDFMQKFVEKLTPADPQPCEDSENIYECSCGYGWDKNKMFRHHYCPNCGKMVEDTTSNKVMSCDRNICLSNEYNDIGCDKCICNATDGCQRDDIEETIPVNDVPCDVLPWISVADHLPEEKTNPVTRDYYQYPVTYVNGEVRDIRYYKFGKGHWWNWSEIMDKYVTAWMPLPKTYEYPF